MSDKKKKKKVVRASDASAIKRIAKESKSFKANYYDRS